MSDEFRHYRRWFYAAAIYNAVWGAREPERYRGLIWIALAGKTFGPLGFAYSASTGTLPWSFGWICLFNDIIWWPVFWRFALRHAREPSR